jgi:hypothetical protein
MVEYSQFTPSISSSNAHALCDICGDLFNGMFYRTIHTQMVLCCNVLRNDPERLIFYGIFMDKIHNCILFF